MIRRFTRPVREVIVVVALASIVLTGRPQGVFALGSADTPATRPSDGTAARAELERLASKLRSRLSMNPAARTKGSRLLELLDIALTTDRAARHDKIRRLPVTIVTSASADGRAGTVKKFLIDGKVRREVFVAAPTIEVLDPPEAETGPSARDSVRDECYFEEELDECASDQEMEDADIWVAAMDEENQLADEQYQERQAEIDEYCYQNPWACGDPDARETASGPCANGVAAPPCVLEAAATVLAVGTSAGRILGYAGARGGWAGTIRLSLLTVSSHYILIGVAAVATGLAVGAFIGCYYYSLPDQNAGNSRYVFEPVYLKGGGQPWASTSFSLSASV